MNQQATRLIRRPAPQGQAPQQVMQVEGPRLRRDFFIYSISFASLAAGASTSGAIQIQADSDFELQKLTHFTDIAGAAQTDSSRVLPLITVQITDTGNGRQMFNLPVPIPGLMGSGQIPFILQTSKIFTKNASVTVEIANYSAATAYLTRILLIGSKIFSYGA